jgi:hypothetical protein
MRKTILECDIPNVGNPQHVAEFTKDILVHYLKTEKMNQPSVKYMEM